MSLPITKPASCKIPAWAGPDSAIDQRRPLRGLDLRGHAFLTVSEAASLLRVSEKTIRRQIACGGLPVCRVGRSVRISAKAIEALSYSGCLEV